MSPRIFVTADLHLGHENIIKYCHRPFKNARAMDKQLIRNWNDDVNPEDRVYIVGDFIYKASRNWRDYAGELNGTKFFIIGNHDDLAGSAARSQRELYLWGMKFLLMHSPYDIPLHYPNWVIHGHTHNHSTEIFPFISYENKTVNVSVELTNYRPVNMAVIMSLIRNGTPEAGRRQ